MITWQDARGILSIIGIPELILLAIALVCGYRLWKNRSARKERNARTDQREAELSKQKYGGVNIFTASALSSATPANMSAAGANISLADPTPPKPPRAAVDLSQMDRHTLNKTDDIIKRNEGSFLSGFIITLDPENLYDENRLQYVIVDRSAVRWIGKQDFWDIMHPAPSRGYCGTTVTAEQIGAYTNGVTDEQAGVGHRADVQDAFKLLERISHAAPNLRDDDDQLPLNFGAELNHVKPIFIPTNPVLNDKVTQFMQHLEAHLINDIRATISSIEGGRRLYERRPEGLEMIMGLIRSGYSEIHDLAITQQAAQK